MKNLVVWINLNSRPDRDKHMRSQLERKGITYHVRITGTPGGQLGCMASHLKALQYCMDMDESCVILEDDVWLQNGFDHIIPNPNTITFLGGALINTWPGIHKSYGYMVVPEVAQRITSYVMKYQGSDHYDHLMTHPFPYVQIIQPFLVLPAHIGGSDVAGT